MHPILFQYGSLVIPAWHVCFALGGVSAYFFLQRFRKKMGLSFDQVKKLFLICYVAGYFGARALSILVEQPHLHDPQGFLFGLFQLGPMTFYGGFLAAGFCGFLYLFVHKRNWLSVGDVIVVACFLALGIGRIGCFLNGDDFGKPIINGDPFWGVSFPVLKDGMNQVIRYPVQLMETTYVWLFVAAFLWSLKKLDAGTVCFLAFIYYGVGRFILEYFRGDDRGWVVSESLSTSQFISVFIFLGGVIGLFWLTQTREQRR